MNKMYIGIGLTVVALVALGFGAYRYLDLRMVSSVPKQSGSVPYYDPVYLTFNYKLKREQSPKVTITPEVAGKVSIQDRSIVFTPDTGFELNQKYTLHLENVEGGYGLGRASGKLDFTAQYVDDGKRPEDVSKERQTDPEPPAEFQGEDTPDSEPVPSPEQ